MNSRAAQDVMIRLWMSCKSWSNVPKEFDELGEFKAMDDVHRIGGSDVI